MNTLQKSVRFWLVVSIIVGLFVVVVPRAFAEEGDGCDFCGSYDSTYTPGYDSTYTPGYDSTYTPGYDSTYTPGYDSTYWPGYDSTYTPGYDSTYTPGYDSTYWPGYDSTYTPGYDSTYSPGDEWEPVDVITNTYSDYDVYEYTIQDGVAYSERTYDTAGSSYGNSGYTASVAAPFSFRAPSTSYAPSYPTYRPQPQPQPQPQRPVQQPQQQQQQQQQQTGGPINIVNTNTNNNNNVNNLVNSAPVTPVVYSGVSYPIQYVYQQQPVYQPTYPVYPTYPTHNAPYCTITATQGSIVSGQPAYLTWSSSGATSAWLSDGIGAVSTNGSLAVRPGVSKTYTLTVSGYGGTNTCSAYVTVQGSYVTLSQIPYTGFDAGPFGNAIYWLSLISFAIAGAYLAVYYKGGAMTLVGSMLGSRKVTMSEAPVQVPLEATVEAPVETMTPSPIQIDALENLPVAPTAKATMDSMTVVHSKEGTAPRIIITRT